MRRKRSDGIDTRLRLLEAAGEIFARKGFWEASLAEICRAAQANIAAANYHFTSKEALYVAAWRHAHDRLLVVYPPDGGVPPAASPAARLRGRIQAILRRMFDPRGYDLLMIHKEIAFPTGLLTDAIRDTVRPLRMAFRELVRELAGESATPRQIGFCHLSVLTQCFGFRMHELSIRAGEAETPAGPPPPPEKIPPLTPEYIEALAEHVTSFSLAGIRSLRTTGGKSAAPPPANPAAPRRRNRLRTRARRTPGATRP